MGILILKIFSYIKLLKSENNLKNKNKIRQYDSFTFERLINFRNESHKYFYNYNIRLCNFCDKTAFYIFEYLKKLSNILTVVFHRWFDSTLLI